MPEPDGLNPVHHSPDGRTADDYVTLAGGSTEDELAGPDRGREHSALYAVIFLILVGGAMLVHEAPPLPTGPGTHTMMETVATLLAFLVGALAFVRYYSRKQVTFLLIGCGFLGAAILDLNHVVGTIPAILDARVAADPRIEHDSMYAWTWTAGRVYLSLFLFVSLLAWRQEVREGREDMIPEPSVYATALLLTVINLLFFDYVPLTSLQNPEWIVSRPAELIPTAFFALAFAGFYRKGSWRRDQFEHWMLVSLLISALTHGAYMAFSELRFDAPFDLAHLLKITSYVAILTGLLTSVYATFTREAAVLEALTRSNDALAREVEFRSKTEEAVKESSERLQRFLDNANDLIQSVGPEGRFLYVNSSWKRALGYSDEDLDRMGVFDIVHPDHREAFEQEFRRVLDGGEPRRFNVEYLAADGRVVILSGSSQAQYIGDKAVATQSILRDVTEQRMAERRLDESQRNLEALVENTGDSIWSVDRDHRLITLNSAFSLAMEARTGREPRAGMQPEEVFPSEDVSWYRELYDQTLAGERNVAVRTDEVDGQTRYFELYANPIQSVDGVSGAVFFGKDVTQRERAEEALRIAKEEAEAANKAKSDFLANMSHELRTPLNSVIGFTNILLKNKGGRLNQKDLGFLERVLSNGKHLLALINEVLDLAKVEAGRMELIIEEVDLGDLCVETVQQLEGQAKAKEGDVSLVADVPESVKEVETDSAKLKQVIINLVGNALKFTHEGSVTVRLEVASDGRTPVAIAVADTGIGIPDDRLEAIFEAFQQAEAGTSRKYGGTGLGLALSRSICLLMGYDLIVESEVGKGSTFTIVMGERATRTPRPRGPAATRPGQEEARADLEVRGEAPVPVGVDVGPDGRGEGTTGGDDPASTASGSGDGALVGDATVRVDAGSDPRSEPDFPQRDAADGDGEGATGDGWSHFKVLVVDDEYDSRVLIQHYLQEFGCQVFTAASGSEGLELARKHRPDLITVDLLMPGLTGWEVLKILKQDPELRAIPVVVVSLLDMEGRGKLLGAVDMVAKPFEREDLLRVLWRNLGRRRGGRVLLVVPDEERSERLGAVVRARGFRATRRTEGDIVQILGQEAPDAVVLDMDLPGHQALSSLLELREDRVHTGLPVLVLTHDGMTEKEREIVRELATLHAPGESPDAALANMLEISFPVDLQEVDG
ncbi:MAG: PAS domain S-box protein [Longimicrobiales bacterium]|nr:PAS domain S-box protein [Longimicrobiales bacterium]